jgi:uncharacterized protein
VRVVLDTNIMFSAILWRGTPYQLLLALSQRQDTELFTSPILLEELRDTLSRPTATKRLAIINTSSSQALSDYLNIAQVVEPTQVPRIVMRDPDDDHVLAAALACRADIIVSGDEHHLLPIGVYQGIPIITARQALDRIT